MPNYCQLFDVKVAICFPHYGDVKAGFAVSLARMLVFTLNADVSGPDGAIKVEPEVFSCSSPVLPHGRNTLVARALEWGAEWLLMLDADHTFPPDTLLVLLAHSLPMVGCNYMKRIAREPITEPGKGLAQVDHLGLGVVLVHRTVLQAIAATNPGPLFNFETRDGQLVGEDLVFFGKAKAAGYPLTVDHDLSRHIGHIGEVELRLQS
ncbi:MAG: hypothetical protein JWP15_1220 [Alphaproteobacteria bacterium]|nr:hypothetical protein [Alphaproteobacteria bacterium]